MKQKIICFSFDQVKHKVAHFGSMKKCFNKIKFQIFFLAIVLWNKRKVQYKRILKKYSFLRSLWFFDSKIFAAPAAKFADFLELY